MNLFLITYFIIVSVHSGCPDGRPGCAVMHFRSEKKQYRKIAVAREQADLFCFGKEDCTVKEVTVDELNSLVFQSPSEGANGFWFPR